MEEIRYEILQLKEEYADRRFRGMAELNTEGNPIRDEQYQHVYQDTCQPGTSLDAIYTRFNIDRPEDFRGWSLSVGDVILMHEEDGDHAFFVDSIGFAEIQDFFESSARDRTQGMDQNEAGEPVLVTLRIAARDEQPFAYTQSEIILADSGSLGHLRVDMGQDGNEFYMDWSGHGTGDMSEGFRTLFNSVIRQLRTNPAFDGILADRSALSSYCYRHPNSQIPGEENRYAFRLDAGAYAMILRLTPNRGEYNAYIYCYSRDSLDRTLERMRAEHDRGYLRVYRHSASFARNTGDLELWRASHRQNIACRKAIDDAIREHFDGMHLDPQAVRSVLEKYGAERVSYVLANTIIMKEHDGRFSRQNRTWAQAENILIDRTDLGEVSNDEYVAQSHPAVLDGYIDLVRKEMEMPAVEKEVPIQVYDDRQRQAGRDGRAPASRHPKATKQSVRSQIREKQVQAHEDVQKNKQHKRAVKRESR